LVRKLPSETTGPLGFGDRERPRDFSWPEPAQEVAPRAWGLRDAAGARAIGRRRDDGCGLIRLEGGPPTAAGMGEFLRGPRSSCKPGSGGDRPTIISFVKGRGHKQPDLGRLSQIEAEPRKNSPGPLVPLVGKWPPISAAPTKAGESRRAKKLHDPQCKKRALRPLLRLQALVSSGRGRCPRFWAPIANLR